VWTFLSQVLDPDHSCRPAVARWLAWRTARGRSAGSADTGGSGKARARLPEAALAQLTRDTGRRLREQAASAWRWKGQPVQVVDGTGRSRPDTPAHPKAYPQSRRARPGCGLPLLRLVVLFALAVGTGRDAALGPQRGKGTGEPALFRSLPEGLAPGDVLLADRNFCSDGT
jgi:hypothetical protein